MGTTTINHTAPSESRGLISTGRAMEIASWWQSPGREGIGMAQFASTGTVTDDLLDDIARELRSVWQAYREAGKPTEDIPEDIIALEELDSYISACTAPVWTVGSNHAGYMPEGEVHSFLSYADAVGAYADALESAPEDLCGEECECEELADELCDGCSMDAYVKAHLRDDVPWVIRPSVSAIVPTGQPRELSISLRPEDKPIPTVFWLARSERLISDYVAERN